MIINICGLRCPETIMLIRKKVREMDINDILLIITDDITLKRDIYFFCEFMKHEFIKEEINHLPYKFLIKKLH